jgi:monoamine oxidase
MEAESAAANSGLPPALSRRKFLAGALSLTAFPYVARANGITDCDVVIVGAGAAGLAASHALNQAGKSVMLLEATNRTGGRAHTDTRIFGLPYDMGAHWLHFGRCNFFKTYAERHDRHFSISKSPNKYHILIGNDPATEDQVSQFNSAYDEAAKSILAMAESGAGDNPADAIVALRPKIGNWESSVRFNLGPWDIGKEVEHFSAEDWSTAGTENNRCEDDWLCKEGYGAVLAHYADAITVKLPPGTLKLSTRVTGIRLTASGALVATQNGSISCRLCIVTVSTGVLHSGAIRFEPGLPPEKLDAFRLISMGYYNRIALSFGRDVVGLGDDHYLFRRNESPGTVDPPIGFTLNVAGENIVYCDVGGTTAKAVEEMGQAGAIDFALSELTKIFGHDVKQQFIKGHATAWVRNRNTLGSFASPEPGAHRYRDILRKPVEDRIFFAGEACDFSQWATVAGARDSGHRVATMQVLPRLAGTIRYHQFASACMP